MIKHLVFDPLRSAVCAHDDTVSNILKDYREQLKKDSGTYQPQALADRKAKLIEQARKRIEDADKKLSYACENAASRLRTELASYSSRPVDSGLLANLRALKEFGLKMSRSEIETYVKQASGNLTALRIVAALAQENGYTLKYTSAEDFQKDINRLQSCSVLPMLTAPAEYIREAMDVMPNSAWHEGSRPSVTEIATRSAYRKALREELTSGMVERWTHAIPPTVDEIKATVAAKLRENDGEPTPEEEAAAVEKAHADAVEEVAQGVDIHSESGSGARNAFSRERYNAIIEQYK